MPFTGLAFLAVVKVSAHTTFVAYTFDWSNSATVADNVLVFLVWIDEERLVEVCRLEVL